MSTLRVRSSQPRDRRSSLMPLALRDGTLTHHRCSAMMTDHKGEVETLNFIKNKPLPSAIRLA